jgi:DNA-binding transcriptional LysR family regulator
VLLGSFTAAAAALGQAQPSISHHIAQLAPELGAPRSLRDSLTALPLAIYRPERDVSR